MKAGDLIKYGLFFLGFLALQILIFRNVVIFNYAFCFVYIGFLLLLPMEISHILVITIGLCYGLTVDIFYDTIGIHSAASVLIAYMRPYVINILTPRGGYDASSQISVFSLGFQWFLTYSLVLIFIHHFTLFTLEAWGLQVFFRVLLKSLLSSLFTFSILILLQYLFSGSKSSL